MTEHKVHSGETKGLGAITQYSQEIVFNQITHILSRIQGRITPKALEKILRIAESLDRNGEYTREIEGLRKAIDSNHPYLRFFDLIGKKSLPCREKLFRNFFINAHAVSSHAFATSPLP